jgi:gluconolactonase
MKNILKTGSLGLILAVYSCQSVNTTKMFYEDVKPEKVSDQFSFTEGPSSDKEGMCIYGSAE